MITTSGNIDGYVEIALKVKNSGKVIYAAVKALNGEPNAERGRAIADITK